MIKVSVIVPVYNTEKYLEDCLESLVNQTLQNIEIILIDDGSTDRSLEIIERYHDKYPEKVIYRSIENGGAANARNIALQMAKGEYIGFVDSDDSVDLTMYEQMYDLGVETEADIVTCGYNRIGAKGVRKRGVVNRKCFGHNVFKAPGLYTNSVPQVWNKLFKRSLIQEQNAKFEPLRIFEDTVFTYKLFLKANRIVKVPKTLYHYMYQRKDALKAYFSEKSFDLFQAFDLLLSYMKEEGFFYHFEEELLFLLLNHVYVMFNVPVKWKDFFLKIKFIHKSFQYLDRQFPYWKESQLYFAKKHKGRFRYTKSAYWYLKSITPKPVKRVTAKIRAVKRARARSV